MREFLRRLWSPSASKPRAHRSRLQLEALEDRAVPAIIGGGGAISGGNGSFELIRNEFRVNTFTQRAQDQAATASNPFGGSVVVWRTVSVNGDSDIHGQIYDTAGVRRGDEFTISGRLENEFNPVVAMDAQGNFIVVWVRTDQNGNSIIEGKRFDIVGNQIGATFEVGDRLQLKVNPDIAADSFGNFVVTYTTTSVLGDLDVVAEIFRAVGAVVTTTAEINVRGGGVNSGGSNERGASVAMGSDGRFFVSYTATNPANGSADVRVNYYDTNGVRLESHLIAGSAFNEFSQDIGVNGNGNAVVIYQDLNTIGFVDIFARRISTAGTVSNAIQVTTRNELEFNAVVAVNTINPSFAVAYQVINPISGRPEVRVTEVSFVGGDPEALDAIRRRTLRFGNLNRSRTVPALSIDLLGNYQVVYTLLNPFSNNGQDIFAARRRLN